MAFAQRCLFAPFFQFHELAGNIAGGQFEIDQAAFRRIIRHSGKSCAFGQLRKNHPTCGLDRLDADRAVTAGLRQDDRIGLAALIFGQGPEKKVDGRVQAIILVTVREGQDALLKG